MTQLDGLLLLDKPFSFSSHDLVDWVRRSAGTRRVGHAGTLDPMATGLVVILIGKATQLSDKLIQDDKEYTGIMTLGLQTDTQDLEGRILRDESPSQEIDEAKVRAVFAGFVGTREQKIPRYSSARVAGEKSYVLARKNIAFEQRTKTVEIKRLESTLFKTPDIYFSSTVSKGTYIRALCEEIGETLGCGATLSALRRIRSGPFHVKDSLAAADLDRLSAADLKRRLIFP